MLFSAAPSLRQQADEELGGAAGMTSFTAACACQSTVIILKNYAAGLWMLTTAEKCDSLRSGEVLRDDAHETVVMAPSDEERVLVHVDEDHDDVKLWQQAVECGDALRDCLRRGPCDHHLHRISPDRQAREAGRMLLEQLWTLHTAHLLVLGREHPLDAVNPVQRHCCLR